MIERLVPSVVTTFLLVNAFVDAGAQPAKVPRLGVLVHYSATESRMAARLALFREGLRDLGYVEGKTIHIEYRYAEGRDERLVSLAEELIRLKVDVLIVSNDTTARAAQKVTKTVPIVMASSGNPIGQGVIASQARPGGNVTGLTSYSAELVGKRLGLLKEVLPSVNRFGFLNNEAREATGSASLTAFEEAQATAKALKITFRWVKVKPVNPDFEAAFREIAKERIGALVTSPSPPIAAQREKILRLLDKHRLPPYTPKKIGPTTAACLLTAPVPRISIVAPRCLSIRY